MSILNVLIALILLCLAGVWLVFRTRTRWNRTAFIYLLSAAVIVLVSLPISAVVTWLLSPFWNRVGGAVGVRLVNHAGPVVWCYVAVFVMCVILLGSAGMLFLRPGNRRIPWRE